ncbi:hypothetical protein, partial [Bordetella pertussis]
MLLLARLRARGAALPAACAVMSPWMPGARATPPMPRPTP